MDNDLLLVCVCVGAVLCNTIYRLLSLSREQRKVVKRVKTAKRKLAGINGKIDHITDISKYALKLTICKKKSVHNHLLSTLYITNNIARDNVSERVGCEEGML